MLFKMANHCNNVLDYLFQCVKRHPLKTAITCRDYSIDFQTLYDRSRQYGYTISGVDIQKTASPIGVICHRDTESIVALLGVVFSGNFYVPLDPDAPPEKNKNIIIDSGVPIIIGNRNDKSFVEHLDFKGVFISNDDLLSQKLSSFIQKEKDAPLYMVYTSGSTGKPKGVLKSHRSEISFIEAYCDTFSFSGEDIIGNQTPFFFDAAAKDIYLMLRAGITMDIIPTEYFSLPTELIDYLNRKKSHLHPGCRLFSLLLHN